MQIQGAFLVCWGNSGYWCLLMTSWFITLWSLRCYWKASAALKTADDKLKSLAQPTGRRKSDLTLVDVCPLTASSGMRTRCTLEQEISTSGAVRTEVTEIMLTQNSSKSGVFHTRLCSTLKAARNSGNSNDVQQYKLCKKCMSSTRTSSVK